VRHNLGVAKALTVVALLVAVAALAVGVAALREARQANGPPTYAEITAAGVREFWLLAIG
jgi:divalent metal cation (Fe/Co/Zn/Cd) transporter